MLGANRSLRLLCVYVHQYSGAGLGWSSPGVFFTLSGCGCGACRSLRAIGAVCFRRSSLLRAIAPSFIPSALFLFSGIILRPLPLTFTAVIFAPLSYHALVSEREVMLLWNSIARSVDAFSLPLFAHSG